MKTLVIPLLPGNLEEKKDINPGVSICGSAVYSTAVIKALIQYGSYDRYYLVRRSTQFLAPVAESLPSHVYHVSVDQLPNLSQDESTVIFAGQPAMYMLSPWRSNLNIPYAPLTGVIHSMHGHDFFQGLLRLMVAGDMRTYDALVCSTRSGKAVVEKGLSLISAQLGSQWGISLKFQPRLPIIPLGVESARFRSFTKAASRQNLSLPQDAVVFLYLGRFSSTEKCDLVPMIISFCHDVVPKFPLARLILAGDDTIHSLTPSLQSLAVELGCQNQVAFFPNVSSVRKYQLLSAADVFVSPSDNIQETFGITIVEAMAAGLPVIASEWDGYKEIVRHGETGFLVPTYVGSKDRARAPGLAGMFSTSESLAFTTVIDMKLWSQYSVELAKNSGLRIKMGERGREIVNEKYDWRAVIHQYEELWDELFIEGKKFSRSPIEHRDVSFDAMSFDGLFMHYPTATLESQVLWVNPAGVKTIAGKEMRRNLLPPMFEESVAMAVLSTLQKHQSAVAAELITSVAQDYKWPESIVRAHVARLTKFGVLEVRESSSDTTPQASKDSEQGLQQAIAAR